MGFSRQEHSCGSPFLLQGIFLTQESNPHLLYLLHWQADFLLLSHQGSLRLSTTEVKKTIIICNLGPSLMYTFWIVFLILSLPLQSSFLCVCVLIFLLSSHMILMLLILPVVKINVNRIILYVFFHDSFLSTLSWIFNYVDAQIIIFCYCYIIINWKYHILCFHHIIHVHFICHYLKIIQFRQRIWIFNINILGLMFKSFFEM